MYLHPKIFNSDATTTAEMMGIPRSTLLGWVSCNVKKNQVKKWYDIVYNLTWGVVKMHMSQDIVSKFITVEDGAKVNLRKYRVYRGDSIVLSKFCGIAPSKRAKLCRQAVNARARGEEPKGGKFSLVNEMDKMQVRDRKPKYLHVTKSVRDFILEGWYSGTPRTRHGCYLMAMESCEKDGGFYQQYVDPNKRSASAQLSHWLSRLLKRMGFSSRKETISQKVPENWIELSKAFCLSMQKHFKDAKVDVIVCADQTFVKFRLAKEKLIVP